MENNESTIEIERVDGKLISAKLVIPVWTRKDEDDGLLYASIPMLNLETYGIDEDDLEIAIQETVEGFILVSEKFGEGIESELADLEWEKQIVKEPTHIYFDFKTEKPVYKNMINTGNSKLLSYHI